MLIRLLSVIAAIIFAIIISRKIELSTSWTCGFTLAVGGIAAIAAIMVPLNLSEYVTTTKTYETTVASRYIAQNDMGPVMLAAYIHPVVVPASTGNRYRQDCYVAVDNGGEQNIVFKVSKADYGTLLEGAPVEVTYYYIGGEIYDVRLWSYRCVNNIPLRDSNIFKQEDLLRAALPVNYGMQEDAL